MAPICSFELQGAASQMPLVFVKDEDSVNVMGLMGLQSKKNLFIDTEGKWDSPFFLPAVFAAYPFQLAKAEDNRHMILFDEDSKNLVEGGLGNRLFDDDQNETETFLRYTRILTKIGESEIISKVACQLLLEFNLLQGFKFELPQSDTKIVPLDGLYRIDLSRFNNLEDDRFLKLRRSHTLEFIYAHLFSLNCISKLLALMNLRGKTENSLKGLGAKIFESGDEAEFSFK